MTGHDNPGAGTTVEGCQDCRTVNDVKLPQTAWGQNDVAELSQPGWWPIDQVLDLMAEGCSLLGVFTEESQFDIRNRCQCPNELPGVLFHTCYDSIAQDLRCNQNTHFNVSYSDNPDTQAGYPLQGKSWAAIPFGAIH